MSWDRGKAGLAFAAAVSPVFSRPSIAVIEMAVQDYKNGSSLIHTKYKAASRNPHNSKEMDIEKANIRHLQRAVRAGFGEEHYQDVKYMSIFSPSVTEMAVQDYKNGSSHIHTKYKADGIATKTKGHEFPLYPYFLSPHGFGSAQLLFYLHADVIDSSLPLYIPRHLQRAVRAGFGEEHYLDVKYMSIFSPSVTEMAVQDYKNGSSHIHTKYKADGIATKTKGHEFPLYPYFLSPHGFGSAQLLFYLHADVIDSSLPLYIPRHLQRAVRAGFGEEHYQDVKYMSIFSPSVTEMAVQDYKNGSSHIHTKYKADGIATKTKGHEFPLYPYFLSPHGFGSAQLLFYLHADVIDSSLPLYIPRHLQRAVRAGFGEEHYQDVKYMSIFSPSVTEMAVQDYKNGSSHIHTKYKADGIATKTKGHEFPLYPYFLSPHGFGSAQLLFYLHADVIDSSLPLYIPRHLQRAVRAGFGEEHYQDVKYMSIFSPSVTEMAVQDYKNGSSHIHTKYKAFYLHADVIDSSLPLYIPRHLQRAVRAGFGEEHYQDVKYMSIFSPSVTEMAVQDYKNGSSHIHTKYKAFYLHADVIDSSLPLYIPRHLQRAVRAGFGEEHYQDVKNMSIFSPSVTEMAVQDYKNGSSHIHTKYKAVIMPQNPSSLTNPKQFCALGTRVPKAPGGPVMDNDNRSPFIEREDCVVDYKESFYYPPGYRFAPTDYALVDEHLDRKLKSRRLWSNVIHEVDLYDHNPRSLTG
ncbi:hypothetical protein RJ639_046237 [Escallonia herrerae]|uniref:NAC domain-containing protein n=1 Tax=Escallonia herrerae TaxID=1293975 RepID=A0AA88W902_9ASTE|nr:hypothetical protein RJ639_046237 [Escallonia herrerae]